MRTWGSRVLIGAATLAVLLGGWYVLGDEYGMPTAYEYRGMQCERTGDLLLCDRPGPSTDVYVRHRDDWAVPTGCRDVSSTLTRCAGPYRLEIDYGGEWAELHAPPE